MTNLGSGANGEFTFLDVVSLISFYIGVENLNQNLSQNDKQEMLADLNEKTKSLLAELHGHLEKQDKKLDLILEKLAKLEEKK